MMPSKQQNLPQNFAKYLILLQAETELLSEMFMAGESWALLLQVDHLSG